MDDTSDTPTAQGRLFTLIEGEGNNDATEDHPSGADPTPQVADLHRAYGVTIRTLQNRIFHLEMELIDAQSALLATQEQA